MNDFVGCTIVGRLTRDSELKYTNSGLAVAHFSVATSHKTKDGEKPSFWDCEIWGKQAETLNQYLTKGKQVVVHGTMNIETWEQDGVKKSKVKVNGSTITLLSGGEKKQETSPAATNDDISDIPF